MVVDIIFNCIHVLGFPCESSAWYTSMCNFEEGIDSESLQIDRPVNDMHDNTPYS